MALGTPVHKTSFSSDANVLTYGPTAAVTAAAGDLIVVSLLGYAGVLTTPAVVTLTDSASALRWAQIGRRLMAGANEPRLAVFAALAPAAFTGTLTVGLSAAARGLLASVDVFPGVSQAAPVRAANVVTSEGTGTGGTSTLPVALADAGSYHLCVVAHDKNNATTVGSGFTSLADFGLVDSSNASEHRLAVQWKANDLTCDPSWATSVAWAMLSAEIQEVVYAPPENVARPAPLWLVEITPALT